MSTGTTENQDDLINAALDALAGPSSTPTQRPAGTQDRAPILSPTLQNLAQRRRPDPATVCETCPNSVWFTSPKEVKCYCRVMYLITWSTRDPNHIVLCDGVFIGQEGQA